MTRRERVKQRTKLIDRLKLQSDLLCDSNSVGDDERMMHVFTQMLNTMFQISPALVTSRVKEFSMLHNIGKKMRRVK